MKEKILILGCTGMAGHLITLYFQERGYDVYGLSNTPFPLCKNNIICDVTDVNKFSDIVNSGNFDVIINCIGLLNKACDERKDLAVYLNSYIPHYVCNLIKNSKTKYIHMSTDCVYSGKTGPYNEHSFRDGETFYDRTKALGEVDDDKNLTFRNSIIGPDMNEKGIGLFNWFMNSVEKDLNGFCDVKWTGVTTLELAKAMERAIECNLTGIYNLVNNSYITKFDMLKEFNEIFDREKNIHESHNLVLEKILVNNRDDFSFKVKSYHEMILEMKHWIEDHKNLYPHYYR